MATHIPTTPSGVNASGLPGFSLMHGAVPVPTPLLTAETIALLDAIPPSAREPERQKLSERRARLCLQLSARPIRRSPAARTRPRIRS